MSRSRIVVATTNPGKLREIRSILAAEPVTILGLGDFPPVEEPEETGDTFEENARQKARYYDGVLPRDPAEAHRLTVAEDSGLVLDGLDGEPGVRSARFLGPDATYPERFDAIYARLAARPGASRSARFVCALAAVRQGVVVFEARGVVEGEVAAVPGGAGGFGYDPMFYYPPYGRTLGEVSEAEKNRVAHRGKAMAIFAEWLRRGGSPA